MITHFAVVLAFRYVAGCHCGSAGSGLVDAEADAVPGAAMSSATDVHQDEVGGVVLIGGILVTIPITILVTIPVTKAPK